MSRSRKKYPIMKDYIRGSTRRYKRFASKKIRRYTGVIPDGKQYRKLYDSWNIHDMRYSEWNPFNKWYKLLKRK